MIMLLIRPFHVTDDGLTAVVHMDVLDSDKLLTAMTQASKDLNLRGVSHH